MVGLSETDRKLPYPISNERYARHPIAELTDIRFCIVKLAVSIDRILAFGEVGIVTGRSELEGNIRVHSLSGAFCFTHVSCRYQGNWQLVAGHTSPTGQANSFSIISATGTSLEFRAASINRPLARSKSACQ